VASDLTTVTESVRNFVRETLGCTCPEELLWQIEAERRPARSTNMPAHRVLTVGNRLLIYLWEADTPSLGATVACLLEAGREERNRRGLNRFRLVVVHPDPAQIEPTARQAYAAWKRAGEDRTHLHLVRPEDLPHS
jgi:hypothetical protein